MAVLNIIYYLLFTVITFTILLWIFDSKLYNSFTSKIVEIDGNHFVVPIFSFPKDDPSYIRSSGSKLLCESLQEILKRPIKINKEVVGSRSIITGNPIYTDCQERTLKISSDYKTEDFYKYEKPGVYNKDVYEFYDRLALDSIKKTKISDLGYDHIDVPWTIDLCKNKKCDFATPLELRKKRIKEYIRKKLLEYV